MAWNEPGKNGDGKDPWGGGGRRGRDQGPPDIDEIVKNLTKKFNNLFGGGGSGSGSGGGGRFSAGLVAGLFVVVAVIWGFMGFYIVDAAERGVVLRFGKVLEGIVPPGLHWNAPLIDDVNLVNILALNTATYNAGA
ncbi:MAG: protease modulator HflK N-terminal domain-containing protein, partial [Proteobacteria bacterium]|nr:protease modulator HflK N-terminal domain-containing protein [Pseudomonadota bacterium]